MHRITFLDRRIPAAAFLPWLRAARGPASSSPPGPFHQDREPFVLKPPIRDREPFTVQPPIRCGGGLLPGRMQGERLPAHLAKEALGPLATGAGPMLAPVNEVMECAF